MGTTRAPISASMPSINGLSFVCTAAQFCWFDLRYVCLHSQAWAKHALAAYGVH